MTSKTTPPTPKIALKDVHKSFGPKRVLQGVDLTVMPSESMVIIGGSGTGKSITIKSVLGLMRPDKALFDSLTVWENVAFRLRRKMPKDDARDMAITKLRRVGLGPENADLFPAELSGGMQKRVGLAGRDRPDHHP